MVRSTGFLVILAFGVLNMIGNSFAVDRLFGTAVHPVTHLMVNILQGAFLIVVLVIVTVYSGELVWRERTARVHEVIDALPVPNWALWGAKLAALAVVVAAMLATAILTGMGIQAARGYYAFEIGVYLRGMLVLAGIPFTLAAVLAVFLQVLTNNRYLGYLLMILYFISGPVLSAWDFNHNLYQYAQAPGARYSDMNGFGHFVEPLAWFSLYWTFAAGMLAVAIHLLWIRGVAGSLRDRLRLARQRFTRPVGAVLATLALGFAGTGGYIFYNTNLLNEYIPGDVREERQARYEQQYKQYEGISAAEDHRDLRRRGHLSRAPGGRHPRPVQPPQQDRNPGGRAAPERQPASDGAVDRTRRDSGCGSTTTRSATGSTTSTRRSRRATRWSSRSRSRSRTPGS